MDFTADFFVPTSTESLTGPNGIPLPPGSEALTVPVVETAPAPNSDLLEAMIKLGLPFTDTSLLKGAPGALVTAQLETFRNVGAVAVLGRRLLAGMHAMRDVTLQQGREVAGPSGVSSPLNILQETGRVLKFNDITEEQRTLILFEILVSCRAKPLTTAEMAQLKVLPLFTIHSLVTSFSTSASPCVSIADCPDGLFWCESKAVLDSVLLPTTEGSEFFSFIHLSCLAWAGTSSHFTSLRSSSFSLWKILPPPLFHLLPSHILSHSSVPSNLDLTPLAPPFLPVLFFYSFSFLSFSSNVRNSDTTNWISSKRH